MNVEKAAFLEAAERVGVERDRALELWDELSGPVSVRSGWLTPENVARAIAPIKAIHHKFFGPEAALSSVPLALMRTVCGNDFTVRLRGKPFTVNLHDTIVSFEVMVYRRWQPLETMLYERLLRPGDRVVDVGANIGYFSVLFAELVGKNGRVLAIEPEPNNARLLRKNVEQRDLAQIVAIAQTAVGAAAGTATLYVASSGNLGDNRLYDSEERRGLAAAKGRTATQVPITRVDDLTPDWTRADFIKMDIQGFEAQALEGMRGIVSRSPELLLFTEFFPFGMRAAGSDPAGFLGALRAQGFAIWETRDGASPLVRLRADEDAAFAARMEPGREEANLLCARGEQTIRRVERLAGA